MSGHIVQAAQSILQRPKTWQCLRRMRVPLRAAAALVKQRAAELARGHATRRANRRIRFNCWNLRQRVPFRKLNGLTTSHQAPMAPSNFALPSFAWMRAHRSPRSPPHHQDQQRVASLAGKRGAAARGCSGTCAAVACGWTTHRRAHAPAAEDPRERACTEEDGGHERKWQQQTFRPSQQSTQPTYK